MFTGVFKLKNLQILGLWHSGIMELRDLVNRLFIHKLSTDSGGGRTKVELSGKTVIYKDWKKGAH